MDIFIIASNLLVNLWLLELLQRERVWKQLPWFVAYIGWEVASGCLNLAVWLFGHRFYGVLYWSLEAIEVVLIVAAVRESFLRLFQGFTHQSGFRWSVWSVIGGVVIYSAWKAAYAPPVRGTGLAAFVVGAEFLFRWAIFGIALLTAILGFLLGEPPESREDAVVTGFGVASAGFLVYVISVSLFGTKYIFLTRFAPTVGYFLAAFWWIWVFSHPIQQFGFKELGMGPDEIREALRRSRELGERIIGKRT